MSLTFKTYKYIIFALFVVFEFSGYSQDKTTLKAQFAFGINSPSSSGFVSSFEPKGINFPTINLGLQYMFNQPFGAKLDFGYNRFSNDDSSPEFKVNYSRINAQLVYDASMVFGFLPPRIGTFVHAGPGISMIKPLGDYPENKTSFLNAMAGIEFHFGVSDTFSAYIDTSYIYAFSKDFNPISDGYGSFNGNLLTITIGASVSLSGCRYCD